MTSDGINHESLLDMINQAEDRDNSYELPSVLLNQGIEYNGARVQKTPLEEDVLAHVKKLIAMEVKEDDVFILAFPKCGTHWIWEVVQMLLNQTTQYEKRTKENVMMEMVLTSDLESEKSPRVLNSHLFMCHLPAAEIVAKKAKIIHLVRNPKDTTVSYYHHLRQISKKGFDFWNFARGNMNNVLMFENQFEFLRQMSQFEKSHPDHPIMHLYYEDMKKDPVKGVKDLAEFLQVPASDKLAEEIASACSFDKMKKVDETKESPALVKEILEKMDIPSFKLYRKGTIGDWKNHFTVAQNEIFDDFIRKETEKGLDFKFIYE